MVFIPRPDTSGGLDRVELARRYIAKMPAAKAGENGHNRCFSVAAKLLVGFGLSKEQAFAVLKQDYNPRCDPPWSDKELHHKLDGADKIEGDRGTMGQLSDDDTPPWEKNEKPKPPPLVGSLAVLGALMGRLRAGEGDIVLQAPSPFIGFEVGPGKITVVGAPPGAGKTAATMQLVFGLLEHTETEIVLANAEMTLDMLFRRELTRRSGVGGKALRFADLSPGQMAKVEESASELVPFVDRLHAIPPPYTPETLSSLAGQESRGRLLVLDYLQKFAGAEDPRIGVNNVMGTLRTLAHAGWGILAISSVTRRKKGEELSMSSFKESGEIEFNADACYLMLDEGPSGSDERVRNIKLDCVKNRHGELHSMDLIFDQSHMTFSEQIKAHSEFAEYSSGATF